MTEVGCSTREDVAKRCCTAGITSMTTFFESDDLLRHMFNCIEKDNWKSATLVCKGWRDMSYTMPTWRTASISMARVDGPYKKTPHGISEVSRLSLKEILIKRNHIVRFLLRRLDYESWAFLAPSMAHVQWLDLTVQRRDGEENGKGEMEPFRMDGLPSLTFLRLHGDFDKLTTSIALHLPALLSLNHNVFDHSRGLDLLCPKLESLALSVRRGTVIMPSLFSNLLSLEATFYAIPDSMLDGNGTELVLGACPRLTSLTFRFSVGSFFITSLALDLPSLEYLSLSDDYLLETLRLTCPNLVHVDLCDRSRLSLPPTLMAQLTTFDGNVGQMVAHRKHGNEANHRHVIKGWPVLKRLRLRRSGVDVTLMCPSLCHLTVLGMDELETCKVVSPVLSDLNVVGCLRLDVSSLIQPSLEKIRVYNCNLEEGTEWTLPNLRELNLSVVKTTHKTVNYAPPTSDGVDGGGQVHQLSVDWKEKRPSSNMMSYKLRGVELRVRKENVIFLDAKDCATKLRIVAPSATKLHLKRCGALKELDIDSRLLLELVVGNSPSTIKKMVDKFSHKCPWLKKVTLEM